MLKAFEPVAGPPGSLLAACAACARPLVASDADADALFAAALAHDLSGWPYVRARTLLSYGRWLRSRRRAAEALTALRVACDELDMLGAHAFAACARDELRALGATQGAPAPRARVDLTPQERLIAKLRRRRVTNHQIAEQLVLSHRTIGSHLYQIFPKLGISFRAQLRAALRGGPMTALHGREAELASLKARLDATGDALVPPRRRRDRQVGPYGRGSVARPPRAA